MCILCVGGVLKLYKPIQALQNNLVDINFYEVKKEREMLFNYLGCSFNGPTILYFIAVLSTPSFSNFNPLPNMRPIYLRR